MGRASVLCGLGGHVPPHVVTNHDLAQALDTSDEWIRERTGIIQRHIAAEGEHTSDLATRAAIKALKAAGLSATDIDMIVVATSNANGAFTVELPAVHDDLTGQFTISASMAAVDKAAATESGSLLNRLLIFGTFASTAIFLPPGRWMTMSGRPAPAAFRKTPRCSIHG